MKKILILLLSIVTLSASAQVTGDSVLRSKKGTPILPQKGDWAIGADALPYLEYLGNMFNNTEDNTLNLGSQTLYGRYFVANNAAVRFLVQISQGTSLDNYYVRDDAAFLADPLSRVKTTDVYKYKYSGHYIDLGYQKFRGYGRLQGFYGAHVGFGVSRSQYEYNYGNPITIANATPTIASNYNSDNSRTLEEDNGVSKYLRAGLIAGVEYYFLPKVCIGGEISLSVYHSWSSQGNSKYERLNGSVVEEYETADSPKGRNNTSISTSRPANYDGSLYLMFHF